MQKLCSVPNTIHRHSVGVQKSKDKQISHNPVTVYYAINIIKSKFFNANIEFACINTNKKIRIGLAQIN